MYKFLKKKKKKLLQWKREISLPFHLKGECMCISLILGKENFGERNVLALQSRLR